MARDPLPRLRRIGLSFPGAWEKLSHGEPTFWVGKRMFATYASASNHHGGGRNAVWCRSDFVTQDFLLSNAPDRISAAVRGAQRLNRGLARRLD